DEGIRTRRAHLGGEKTAALAVADGPREGGGGACCHPTLSRDGGGGERGPGHHEEIVRGEGMGGPRHWPEGGVGREGGGSRDICDRRPRAGSASPRIRASGRHGARWR